MKESFETLINQKEKLGPEQILDVFFKIGLQQDIILLKNDGLRDMNSFTVVITSGNNSFESIRRDGKNLAEAVKNALKEYVVKLNKRR